MAVRSFPGGPSNGGIAKNVNLSGASLGTKITYTCPTGFAGRIAGVTVVPTAGAATLQITVRLSGSTVIVDQSTLKMAFSVPHALNAGDTVNVAVSVLDAASLFDAVISVDEYPVV